jgi:hypothetical protein
MSDTPPTAAAVLATIQAALASVRDAIDAAQALPRTEQARFWRLLRQALWPLCEREYRWTVMRVRSILDPLLEDAREEITRRGYCSVVKRATTALRDQEITKALAANIKSPRAILDFLRNHPDEQVRRSVAHVSVARSMMKDYRRRQRGG